MSFVKKIKSPAEKLKDLNQTRQNTGNKKIYFYKKKGWKIFFVVFFLLLIAAISYGSYIISSGAKVFDNGINAGSIKKILTGEKEKLKGQDEGRINILLEGMGGVNHPGGMLTDSIVVLSIDPTNNKAAMLSIPRDLQVKIPGFGENKINSAYSSGYTDYMAKKCGKKNQSSCVSDAMQAGASLSMQTVSDSLNLPIHYYVTVDFKGFEDIINQIGGIDVYVDKALNDPLFPADDMVHYAPFKITAGLHHMDGATALKYARSRETTSDFDRAGRQQKIIKSIEEKASSMGILANPKKIADLSSTLGNSIKTNFTASELVTFIEMIKAIPKDQIINKVLTNGPGGLLVDYNNGTYYLKPRTGNFREIQKFIENIFSETPIEDSTVEIINSSGTSGLAGSLSKTLRENYSIDIASMTSRRDKLAKTTIIDYTSGHKPMTLKNLQTEIKTSNVETKTSKNKNFDFTIIIGDDYNQIATQKK